MHGKRHIVLPLTHPVFVHPDGDFPGVEVTQETFHADILPTTASEAGLWHFQPVVLLVVTYLTDETSIRGGHQILKLKKSSRHVTRKEGIILSSVHTRTTTKKDFVFQFQFIIKVTFLPLTKNFQNPGWFTPADKTLISSLTACHAKLAKYVTTGDNCVGSFPHVTD